MEQPIKADVPKSPVPGMNTKIVGRVKPVSNFKQPVEKIAADKAPVEKAGIEKEAGILDHALAGPAIRSAAAAGGALLGSYALTQGLQAAQNKFMEGKYKQSLEKAILLNPRLANIPRNKLEAYFGLVIEASPAVAKNPLLIANYLEQLIDHEGQLNYNSYANLVDLEGQILANKNNRAPLTVSTQKAIVDNTIKNTLDIYHDHNV